MRNDPLHARQYDTEINHFDQRDACRIFPCITEIFLYGNLCRRHTDSTQRQLTEKAEYKAEQYGEGVLHCWLTVDSRQLRPAEALAKAGLTVDSSLKPCLGLSLGLSLGLGLSLRLSLRLSPKSHVHFLQSFRIFFVFFEHRDPFF